MLKDEKKMAGERGGGGGDNDDDDFVCFLFNYAWQVVFDMVCSLTPDLFSFGLGKFWVCATKLEVKKNFFLFTVDL